MTNGEWFMITTTQPLEVKRNGTCVWLCFDNEDANHYALPIKWWDEERVDTSKDLIRRSDAIKEVKKYRGLDRLTMAMLADDLRAIPSIEPKRGEWIFDDPLRADFECSECLERNDICTPFCPNCGADMRGDKE